jgi:hypothetical protein
VPGALVSVHAVLQDLRESLGKLQVDHTRTPCPCCLLRVVFDALLPCCSSLMFCKTCLALWASCYCIGNNMLYTLRQASHPASVSVCCLREAMGKLQLNHFQHPLHLLPAACYV